MARCFAWFPPCIRHRVRRRTGCPGGFEAGSAALASGAAFVRPGPSPCVQVVATCPEEGRAQALEEDMASHSDRADDTVRPQRLKLWINASDRLLRRRDIVTGKDPENRSNRIAGAEPTKAACAIRSGGGWPAEGASSAGVAGGSVRRRSPAAAADSHRVGRPRTGDLRTLADWTHAGIGPNGITSPVGQWLDLERSLVASGSRTNPECRAGALARTPYPIWSGPACCPEQCWGEGRRAVSGQGGSRDGHSPRTVQDRTAPSSRGETVLSSMEPTNPHI